MFAYNPTTNDISGQLKGAGIANSAAINAQAKVDLANSIAGAATSVAGGIATSYMNKQAMQSSVKAGDQMLNMFGDQLGVDQKMLQQFDYDKMGLEDKYQFHQTLWGNLGAIGNLRMANRRLGVQQAAPAAAAGLRNQQDVINQGGNQIQGARWQRNP